MKSKFIFEKSTIGLITLVIFLVGCSKEVKTKIPSKKEVFNGLYTVKYEDLDKQYIWIFAEDICYVLYPETNSEYLDPDTQISYETPTHYYVEGNKFYSCGIESIMKATPLDKCKKADNDPKFDIISIDTIIEHLHYNYQKIILENFGSKSHKKIILKKRL